MQPVKDRGEPLEPARLALLGSVLEAFWWQRFTAAGTARMTPDQLERVVDDVLLPIAQPAAGRRGSRAPARRSAVDPLRSRRPRPARRQPARRTAPRASRCRSRGSGAAAPLISSRLASIWASSRSANTCTAAAARSGSTRRWPGGAARAP